MKKLLSLVLAICMLLAVAVPVSADVSTGTKLTLTETAMVKAYQTTMETQNLQYINKYKYPGLTYLPINYGAGVKVKILQPQYSKSYDAKAKLNKLTIKGLLVATNGDNMSLSNITTSIYVKLYNKKQYLYKEVAAETPKTVTVDSLNDASLTALETYLVSAYGEEKALALMYPETAGAGTAVGESTVPAPVANPAPAATAAVAGGNGTLKSPIALNQKHTWTETKDYIGDTMYGTYSCTVKSVKKITAADIVAMGFREPETNAQVEYALVDVLWEVSDARLVQKTGEGYAFLGSGWALPLWGTKTPDNNAIIGGTDFGFDGSLRNVIDDITDFKKITPGMKEAFTAEGKVLLTLYKGDTNYMVLENNSIQDYDSKFIYFKLQ